MSTVDETVRQCILSYPILFKTRTEVLHHILCVLGSGFVWSNGEAVRDYYDDGEPSTWNREKYNEENLFDYAKDFSAGFLAELRAAQEKRADEYERIVAEVDSRMYLRKQVWNFYPQTDYSLLMELPKDVTEDWQAAVSEIRAEAMQAGWVF